MTDPEAPDPEKPDPEKPDPEKPAPLLRRVVRATFAPDVLEDGGHDAPLSPRGRILYWGTVSVLVVAVAVVFVIMLASK